MQKRSRNEANNGNVMPLYAQDFQRSHISICWGYRYVEKVESIILAKIRE
jgi:hypothetical protein